MRLQGGGRVFCLAPFPEKTPYPFFPERAILRIEPSVTSFGKDDPHEQDRRKAARIGPEPAHAPAKAGSYAPAKKFAQGLYFISGCGPSIGEPVTGCLGVNVTAEQGYEYAKNSMLNVLSVLKREIGDLDKVKNVVKVTCFVASAPDFYAQPQVANGGTELLIQLFGEEVGMPSRSAVGVSALPLNMPVETEALFEVEE